MTAPARPFYLELVRTTFMSSKPLAELRAALEGGFTALNLTTDESDCGYTCEGVRYGDKTFFEVSIYLADPPLEGHQVEVRRMDGCRHAFAAIADELSGVLQVTFREGAAMGIPVTALPLAAEFPPPKGSRFS